MSKNASATIAAAVDNDSFPSYHLPKRRAAARAKYAGALEALMRIREAMKDQAVTP